MTVVVSAVPDVPVPGSVLLIRGREGTGIGVCVGATDGSVDDALPRSVEFESFGVALLIVVTDFAGGNSS